MAAEGIGGLDEYPQLHMLMYLINKHCGADSSNAEAAGEQGGAPAEQPLLNAAAAAAALVAAVCVFRGRLGRLGGRFRPPLPVRRRSCH